MAACSCNSGLTNTGVACSPIEKEAKKLFFTEYLKADGSVNTIDLTDTFDNTFWSGLVNNSNKKLRLFPTPLFYNALEERADPTVETTGDGIDFFVQDGKKTFTCEFWATEATNGLIASLESGRCVNLGAYIGDKDGNFRGNGVTGGAGFIAPYKIVPGSISVKKVYPTGSTVAKVVLSFSFSPDEKDSDGIMITASEMAYSPMLLSGLLDVNATYTNITTTSFKVKLTTKGGTAINPSVVEGLVSGDFALYNVTDAASVSVSTAVESPAGTYTITYTAQSSADVLRLTPTKTGYDFANVVASTVVIP